MSNDMAYSLPQIYLGMMRNLCFTHESTLHSGFPYFVIQLGLMPDDLTCLILYFNPLSACTLPLTSKIVWR